MVRLRILKILEEKKHSKYWLYKQMDLSYQNFNRLITNKTKAIRFENIDKLSEILDCPIGDLFEKIDGSDENQNPDERYESIIFSEAELQFYCCPALFIFQHEQTFEFFSFLQ